MTDYTAITDTQVDPDAPLTSGLAYAWRDNTIAISEGSLNAPINQAIGHPYDAVFVGDGNDGMFYNHAVAGSVSEIITPSFEPGYYYEIFLVGIQPSFSSTYDLKGQWYIQETAGYDPEFLISASVATTYSGVLTPATRFQTYIFETGKTTIGGRIFFPGGTITAGKAYMYRTRIFLPTG